MYHYLKNKRVNQSAEYYQRAFSISLFPELLTVVYGTDNPSGRINPEKQKELYQLIDNTYFFAIWPVKKSFEKNAWNEQQADAVFKTPKKLIKHCLNSEINVSEEKLNDVFNTLKKDIQTYEIDEYYGEYIWFEYIKIPKADLLKI